MSLDIPATSIAAFLNAMPATYVASSIDFASVDHYAAFVDVNAELVSAHAHLHALDSLLANATSLNAITTLEQQIEAVTVEIDTDQGQLNALTASVDMAMATIALSERGATIAASAPSPLNDGLTGGWHNAVQLTGDVLDVVITALPCWSSPLWHWPDGCWHRGGGGVCRGPRHKRCGPARVRFAARALAVQMSSWMPLRISTTIENALRLPRRTRRRNARGSPRCSAGANRFPILTSRP